MKKVLMAVEGEKKRFAFIKAAFERRGFAVKTVPVRNLTLLTDSRNTKVRAGKTTISGDAVYLETPLKLTQFVEPLLDEINSQGFYCQLGKGSFYIGSNELLQLSVLNSHNIKIPRTFLFGSLELVRNSAEKFSYPVILKVYRKGEKIQSVIAKDSKELVSLAGSIAGENALVREYISGDVDHCAVIGGKVFCLKRAVKEDGVSLYPLKKSVSSKLSKTEEETAIHAANVCGCDIATVKMCKGFVLKVKPYVNMVVFNKKTGEDIFDEIAAFFSEKLGGI